MALVPLASDAFTRADNVDLGAAWDSGYTGFGNLQIVGNQVEGSALAGNGNIESYNAITPGNDQYAQDTLVTYTPGNSGWGPLVRMAVAPTATFYGADTNGSDFHVIRRSLAGVIVAIFTSTVAAASGQVRRLEVLGALLSLYIDGVLAGSVEDLNILSGRVGEGVYVGVALTNTVVDNWSGGTVYSDYAEVRNRRRRPGNPFPLRSRRQHSVEGAITDTLVFRKTLSPIGTRTGSRQGHNSD